MKNKIANRPKIPVMEGEGKTGSGATAKKMAVVLKSGCLEVKECSQPRPQGLPAFQKTLGTRLGVFRVFVELSLEEMLRQQQSKACLYHGRDVFKEMS